MLDSFGLINSGGGSRILSQNDDFFFHFNGNSTSSCTTYTNNSTYRIFLPLCAAISLLCTAYLFWMYFGLKSSVFKRHPTTLAVYKSIMEVLFVQQYLWLPLLSSSQIYEDDTVNAPFYCRGSSLAGFMAFIAQFGLLGSELCFLIISVDLRKAYTNPFTSFKQNQLSYVCFVVGVSTITAAIIIIAGTEVYGLSNLGLLWIQSRRRRLAPNYLQFLFYYAPSIAIYVYCIWANFQFYRGVENNKFSKALTSRLRIMERSKRYTAAYVTYGAVVFILELVSFITGRDNGEISPVPTYFYALRGLWGLLIVLYSNWTELDIDEINPFRLSSSSVTSKSNAANLARAAAKERLLLQPHMNSTLRAEILFFATQGIIQAALDHDPSRYAANAATTTSAAAATTNTHQDAKEDSLQDGSNNQQPPEQGEGNNEAEEGDSELYAFDTNAAGSGIRPSIIVAANDHSLTRRSTTIGGEGGGQRLQSMPGGTAASWSDWWDHRDTFCDLERLETEQLKAVEPLYKAAYEHAGLDKEEEFEEEKIAEDVNNPVRQLADHNNHREIEIELLRPSTSSNHHHRPSGYDNEEGSNRDTDDSQDTIKWRETMDVEYGLRSSISAAAAATRPSHHNNNNNDEESSSSSTGWKMLITSSSRKPAAAAAVAGNHRSLSIDSAVSGTSSSSVAAVRAVLNEAAQRAKSLFAPAYKEFRFKDFKPRLFARIRQLQGISAEDYAKAFISTCRERFSEGRSGAFLFFSSDQKYLVKTMATEESVNLRRILSSYERHLRRYPHSLIVRFLGAHSLTLYGVELFFVVMTNVFPPEVTMSERYDLKGSWVKRHGKSTARRGQRKKNTAATAGLVTGKRTRNKLQRRFSVMDNNHNQQQPQPSISRTRRSTISNVLDEGLRDQQAAIEEEAAPLYQDNDLQHRIVLEPDTAHAIAAQIRADITWLRDLNFMDYSLLIGVKRERFKVVVTAQDGENGGHNSSEEQQQPQNRPTMMAMPVSSPSLATFPSSIDINSSPLLVGNNHDSQQAAVRMRSRNGGLVLSAEGLQELLHNKDNGMRAMLIEGPGTYYLGIIDVLQQWNFTKKMERFLKINFTRVDGDGLSAIAPNHYAQRFWQHAVLDTFEGLEFGDDDLEVDLFAASDDNNVDDGNVQLQTRKLT